MTNFLEGETGVFDLSDEGLAARFAAEEGGQESNGGAEPDITPTEEVSTEQAQPEGSNPKPEETAAISQEQAAADLDKIQNYSRGMTKAFQEAAELRKEVQSLKEQLAAARAGAPPSSPAPGDSSSQLERFAQDPTGYLQQQVKLAADPYIQQIQAYQQAMQQDRIAAQVAEAIPGLKEKWGDAVTAQETLATVLEKAMSSGMFNENPGAAMEFAALGVLGVPVRVDQGLIAAAERRGREQAEAEFQQRQQAKANVPPLSQPNVNKEPLSFEDEVRQGISNARVSSIF